MANYTRALGTQSTTRTIVYSGLIAAAYYVLTIALAPVSFGPLQFRVAGLLVPLCLVNRRYIWGLAIGLALANLFSPFGWWDFVVMPVAAVGYMSLAYMLRRYPPLALTLLSVLSAVSVAVFPLHLGGNVPIWPTVLWIIIPQAIAMFGGWYVIWRNYSGWFDQL